MIELAPRICYKLQIYNSFIWHSKVNHASWSFNRGINLWPRPLNGGGRLSPLFRRGLNFRALTTNLHMLVSMGEDGCKM